MTRIDMPTPVVAPRPGSPDGDRPARARRLARTAGRPSRGRRWADPLPWAVTITVLTLGLWALTGGLTGLGQGSGAALLAVGRLAGLLAAVAALGGLVLTARPRWLERRAGLDRLIGWHRITGMTAAFGMLVHVVATLAAAGGLTGMWGALADLLGTDWYVAALVAAILFAVVAGLSWRRLRAHLRYETWHGIHLAGYLAIALAFPHQLVAGSTFVGSAAAQWWWIALYAATAWIVLQARLGGIAAAALRPRTEVQRVIPEAPGVASLVITGPGVDDLAARPGQFVCLRVCTRDLWWQAHPYSLSAAPRPGALRLTVKALGDASARTIAVPPGTRVMLEGPYGAMTIDRADGRRVLLIGAGVGLAPMRALLEACDPGHAPLVLARAHCAADLPMAAELDALARERGGAMVPVVGARTQFPEGNPFSAEALRRNIPDLTTRAVFVCGPAPLQDAVCCALARAGVPRGRIHAERFAW
ncbi:MAG: ferredoxin reductase family protein [Candidatus Nanopelagicales bacterium]|nr:ferredoxin reductase family protein [Candidatus Nanopelagicales bacterium]